MKIGIAGTHGIPARYGGFETCAEALATRLVERGHEVTVYCKQAPGPEGDRFKGVRLVRHRASVGTRYLDEPWNDLRALSHAAREKYDVLHCFGSDIPVYAFPLKATHTRLLHHIDGLEWNRKSYPWLMRAYVRAVSPLAPHLGHGVVIDNQAARRWYQEHVKSHLLYIPYGVDPFVPSTSAEEILVRGLIPGGYHVFTGRLVQERGADLVVAAAKLLPDETFVIVGDSNDTEYKNALAKDAPPNVRFLGFVYGQGYRDLVSMAKTYLHPSFIDGTSNALLFAMSCGQAIVVSDISENIEVVGEAGRRFATGSADGLAAAVAHLSADPGERARVGEAARRRARTVYDWEAIVDKFEEAYHALVRDGDLRGVLDYPIETPTTTLPRSR